MNTVWRTLVSASVIAAIGAGCGGGSGGGDAPGVTSPQTGAGTTLQKQKLLTIKSGEFKDQQLLSNSQGDLLLVWDDRKTGGAINSMFYHPSIGWSGVKAIAPTTTLGEINSVALDSQGYAVLVMGKTDAIGFKAPDRSFVYLSNTTDWQPALGETTLFGSALLASTTLVADHSVNGIAYFVGLSPDQPTPTAVRLVRVYRLLNTGTWEKLEPAPITSPGEATFACSTFCADEIVASADANGRLHVSYDVNSHGKRSAYWDAGSGWHGAFVLDGDHTSSLAHETFLNINENGKGVAIWQSVPKLGNQIHRKAAWFNGVSWSATESFPDGMSKIDLVNLDTDGATEVFGKDGTANPQPASMRRTALSVPWSAPELFPIDVRFNPVKFLELPGGGWIIPVKQYYKVEPGQASNPLFPNRVRIDEIRYGATGWSSIRTLADQDKLNDLIFAVTSDKLIVVESTTPLGNDEGLVNTFSFAIP